MNPRVVVIDYGMGNLLSVCRALQHCGAEVHISSIPQEIVSAERVVLPGVGAFGDGMRELRERGLDDAIMKFTASERPLLGICLGAQMLLSESSEFGEHQGLDLIKGKVVPVPRYSTDGSSLKVPHVGWNALQATADWSATPLANLPEGVSCYFVHSYHAAPSDPKIRLAVCDYGGHALTAAVRQHNVIGCQFHPEKSGTVGIRMLKSFLES